MSKYNASENRYEFFGKFPKNGKIKLFSIRKSDAPTLLEARDVFHKMSKNSAKIVAIVESFGSGEKPRIVYYPDNSCLVKKVTPSGIVYSLAPSIDSVKRYIAESGMDAIKTQVLEIEDDGTVAWQDVFKEDCISFKRQSDVFSKIYRNGELCAISFGGEANLPLVLSVLRNSIGN